MALVLVVDDDAAIRETLQVALEDEGYQVAAVRDGPAALVFLEHHQPDVVLLDWVLPGMNGGAVHHWLCAHHPDLPVIVLTARQDIPAQPEALASSVLLTKPFELTDLYTTVAAVTARLARSRLEAD